MKVTIMRKGIFTMFKKKAIEFIPESSHLIAKAPGSAFKKGTPLKVPQGYEAILMDQGGQQEVIKNVFELKLDRPVYFVYYAKSNRKIMKTNWGTPTRIQCETTDGLKTLGAFGSVEFQLINPIRFIATRMSEDTFVDESMLAKLVLAKIPDLFHQVVPDLEPIDTSKESVLTQKFKTHLTPKLEQTLDDMGIQVKSFLIENMNFNDVGGE